MDLNYHAAYSFSAFSESDSSDSEEEKEDDFEDSSLELYQNKQNFQTVFPHILFGKEGKYFFPGTYDEASSLIIVLGNHKDQENLFSMYTFPPLLTNKIKDWSYDKLTCSVLYYYLNHRIAKNQLNPLDWNRVGDLIQSSAISREVFSFLKQNNIVNFASKNAHILGFMNSLMFPTYITYYDHNKPVLDVRIFYRFLKLANVEKSTIRDLIRTTINEQNRKAIVYFLHNELKLRK